MGDFSLSIHFVLTILISFSRPQANKSYYKVADDQAVDDD